MIVQTYFIYIGMVLFSSLFAYFESISRTKAGKRFWIACIILLLTCICGLRSTEVGRDSAGYAYNFENQILSWYEPGFVILQKVLYFIFPNYTFFFLVVAFFTNFFFIKRFYDFEDKGASFFWSVLFFTATGFTVGFNGMRQWLAVSICFYSTRYLFNDEKIKLLPFILLNAVAVSFHYSAMTMMLFLIPVILSKTKNSKVQFIRFISLMGIVAGVFLTLYFFRERSYEKLLDANEFQFGFMVVAKLLVIALIIINYKIEKRDCNSDLYMSKKQIKFSYGWFIITECSYVALSSLSYGFDVFGRVAWYLEPFESLYFANIFSRKTRSIFIWIARIIIIVIIVAKFMGNFSVTEKRFPYMFFWQ